MTPPHRGRPPRLRSSSAHVRLLCQNDMTRAPYVGAAHAPSRAGRRSSPGRAKRWMARKRRTGVRRARRARVGTCRRDRGNLYAHPGFSPKTRRFREDCEAHEVNPVALATTGWHIAMHRIAPDMIVGTPPHLAKSRFSRSLPGGGIEHMVGADLAPGGVTAVCPHSEWGSFIMRLGQAHHPGLLCAGTSVSTRSRLGGVVVHGAIIRR